MGRKHFRLLACSFVAMGLLLASFVLGPVSALADTTDPSAPAPGTDPGSSTGTGTGTDTTGGTTGSDTGPSDTGTTGSDPQSGGTQSSDPSSPTSTDTGTTDPTQVPDSTSSTSPGALDTETTPPALTLTITDHPTSVSTAGTGAFTWSTNQAGVSFSCQLDRVAVGASLPGTPAECGKTTTDTTTTSGTTYTGLKFGRYTFTVTATAPDTTTVAKTFTWQVGQLFAPTQSAVTTGASFNNPYGTASAQRRNLHRIIVAVNSMPGYVVNVPSVMCDRDHVPSTIRITVYSMTDLTLARALRNASDRCVSVQVLMDGHLTPKNTKSVALLESALGNHVYTAAGSPRRSFSHRCHAGCRGGGVLHTKMYLFDSDVAAPSGPTIKNAVLAGSSNMTSNASKVQWNDLYGVANRPTLYSQFLSVFNRMKRDRDERRTLSYSDGIYRAVFTPITPGSADPLMSALRSIHCVGATSGNAGHTVVYINIHAWFESRGYALAQRVRSMSFHGCQINVLYSFMSKSVFNVLRTSPRMSLRRTAFPKRDGIHAAHYSHFKMIAANGYVGSSRGARVVWTGSNNFTNDGTHFDELTLRIASGTTYGQYARQFAYMRSTHSTSVYAKLLEPIGGGRPINSHV